MLAGPLQGRLRCWPRQLSTSTHHSVSCTHLPCLLFTYQLHSVFSTITTSYNRTPYPLERSWNSLILSDTDTLGLMTLLNVFFDDVPHHLCCLLCHFLSSYLPSSMSLVIVSSCGVNWLVGSGHCVLHLIIHISFQSVHIFQDGVMFVTRWRWTLLLVDFLTVSLLPDLRLPDFLTSYTPSFLFHWW